MSFNALNFILTKKSGLTHCRQDINEFIESAIKGAVPDYQISAWLMAVCFRGLSFNETVYLTQAMADSGRIYEWDNEGPPVVDKHSTGGVGDTVTLIVAPLAASMGMRMGKHSGRGLGHTGGTIDKLESIPGFRTSLTEKEFRHIVNKVGCAVAGQDSDMTPADGLLYALRDVTGTVEQESLIASSIMSKKLAGGAKYILLDVKIGRGAFMKDIEQARSLAKLMIKIGRKSNRKVRAILTAMNEPLGNAVGNALEVREAIQILRNAGGNTQLRSIAIESAAHLGSMSGLGSIASMRKSAISALKNGKALKKFGEMVKNQGGDIRVIDEPDSILPAAAKVLTLKSNTTGYITKVDALEIGNLVRDLGGGRKSKNDKIDLSVGVVLYCTINDHTEKGDKLCEIHTNGMLKDSEVIERMTKAIRISKHKRHDPQLIIDVL